MEKWQWKGHIFRSSDLHRSIHGRLHYFPQSSTDIIECFIGTGHPLADLVLKSVSAHISVHGDGGKNIILLLVGIIRAAGIMGIQLKDIRPQIGVFLDDILPAIEEQMGQDVQRRYFLRSKPASRNGRTN